MAERACEVHKVKANTELSRQSQNVAIDPRHRFGLFACPDKFKAFLELVQASKRARDGPV